MGQRRRAGVLLTIGLLVLAAASTATARTWHVERDGSGDFTVIQDAVDAAADGDTIRIGPGRYDDWVDVHAPAWTEQAIVWITKDNLVFIGGGADVTHIGPETYYSPPGDLPKVVCCVDEYRFSLENMTIENCREGVYAYGRLEMYSCFVVNCEFGIGGFTEEGMRIDETVFSSQRGASYAIVTYYPADVVNVTDCEFSGNGLGVSFTSARDVNLSDSEFTCAVGNIMFYGSVGTVDRCIINGAAGQGIIVGNNSEVQIVDSSFCTSNYALTVHSGSIVGVEASVIAGGTEFSTIHLYSTSQVNMHGCHILNGGAYSVKLDYFFNQFIEQDMTGNYWGTTDTDQIDAWIWDQNDDPTIHSVVNYLPIADGPVQTESTTWGAVKSLFR